MGLSYTIDWCRARFGRCQECRVSYCWTGLPLVRDAACPRCAKPLGRSTSTTRKARGEPLVDVDGDAVAR